MGINAPRYWVQLNGGSGDQRCMVLFIGECGAAGRQFPGAININTHIDVGEFASHSELWKDPMCGNKLKAAQLRCARQAGARIQPRVGSLRDIRCSI